MIFAQVLWVADTPEARYMALAGMLVFCFLAGAWKFFSLSCRPGANPRCMCALAMFLLAWGAMVPAVFFRAKFPLVAGFFGVTGLACFLRAAVLAVKGLGELSRTSGTFTRGYGHALFTLVLSAFAIVLTAIVGFLTWSGQMPGQIVPPARQQLGPVYVSTNFQFRVRLSDPKWRPWTDVAKKHEIATFGMLYGDQAKMAVGAFSLANLEADTDALQQAFRLALGLGGGVVADSRIGRRDVVERGISGVELETLIPTSRENDDLCRIKILPGSNFVWLVVAWADTKNPDHQTLLEEAFSLVEWPDPLPDPPELTALEPNEREAHHILFEKVGLAYMERRQFDRSAAFLRGAWDCRSEQSYSPNLVEALTNAGKYDEALKHLEESPGAAKRKPAVMAQTAIMLGRVGKVDEALQRFEDLFGHGYMDTEAFIHYITFRLDAGQFDRASEELKRYMRRDQSLPIRVLEAAVLVRRKQWDSAISLLRDLRRAAPDVQEIVDMLAHSLFETGRFTEAMDLSRELFDQSGETALAYFVQGRSELGLKQYAQAKASFEHAARLDPANRNFADWIDQASAILGQGANTGIKEPIAPVAIPAALLAAVPGESPDNPPGDHGASYTHNLVALSFQRGGTRKTTELLTIKTWNAKGVSDLSSLQFGFDPLSEEIFVNRLEVRDASGKVVAAGNVENYFVQDDRSSGIESQRKTLNIPVPGLQPGFSVEVMVTRQGFGPTAEFPFKRIVLSQEWPVRESVVFFSGDTNAIRFASTPGVAFQALKEGLCWRLKSPPVATWEPLQPEVTDYLPAVCIADKAGSWRDMAIAYLNEISERIQLPAREQQLAKAVAAGAGNTEEAIVALARRVQTNLTYKAIEFGSRGRIPPPLGATIGNRYGDCKDHAIWLQQLLRSAGVFAYLAVVNTDAPVVRDLPSLDQFDHMVVYLPGSQGGRFLDCTAKHCSFLRGSSADLAGLDALVLDPREPRFVRVPALPADASRFRSFRELSVTNSVDVLVTETLTVEGVHAEGLRNLLVEMPATARRVYLREELGVSTDLTHLTFENLDRPELPLIFNLKYRLNAHFHNLENDLLGTLPLSFELKCIKNQPVEPRLTPFEIQVPLLFETTVNFHLPAGFKTRGNLPADKLDTRFIRCQVQANQTSDTLQTKLDIVRPAGRYNPGEYTEFCHTLQKAHALLAHKILLQKQPAAVTAGR